MSLLKRLLARNVGPTDRAVRALPSVIVIALWWSGALAGPILILAAVAAAMLLATALTARCSVYAILGLSTCPLREGDRA